MDLSLQPAATPSSGKTLPIPVQITLRFNLPKEREAVPGSPDQPLSSSSCVQPNHRSTVRTGARPPRLAPFVSFVYPARSQEAAQAGRGWARSGLAREASKGGARGHSGLHLEGTLFPPESKKSGAGDPHRKNTKEIKNGFKSSLQYSALCTLAFRTILLIELSS